MAKKIWEPSVIKNKETAKQLSLLIIWGGFLVGYYMGIRPESVGGAGIGLLIMGIGVIMVLLA